MATIAVSIKGDAETREKLKRLGASLYRMHDSMSSIGDYLMDYYGGQSFASRGQVFGSPWAALASSTSRGKDKAGFRQYSSVPLVRSGFMKGAFAKEVGESSVTVSNLAPYFMYHQLGTRKMPQRLIMAINETIKNRVTKTVKEAIEAKLRAA